MHDRMALQLCLWSSLKHGAVRQKDKRQKTGHGKRVRTELETIDALLAHYASGLLPEPARVIVEAHLEIKAANRPLVSVFDEVGGDILMRGEAEPISRRNERLDAIFAAAPLATPAPNPKVVFETGGEPILMPKAIRDFVGLDADRIPWRSKLPGFKEHIVGDFDGFEVSFFWIRPGRAVPAHTHQGCELSIVLDGAFNDARGRFGRGDISLADDSVDHRPVAEKDRPCFGFAVVDAPLKLTGSLRQLIGDLIG
ncbi:anti-ECFsigma factor, ChrR [Rhizobium sp. RU20A]|nr:anti-ECFsigma factor, ChrR [Rhizobium sp. RU20A]